MAAIPPQTLFLTLADGTLVPLAVGGTDTPGQHPSANPAFHVVPQWTLRDRTLVLTLKPLAEHPPVRSGAPVRSEGIVTRPPGAVRHCRLKATNRYGTSYGADIAF